MKTNIAKLTLIAALGFSVAGTSYAHEDYSEGGSVHWISHVMESKSQPTANQLAPYGHATSGAAARGVNDAHDEYSEGGSPHWISHVVAESKSQPTANELARYGYATSGAAARVVKIDSGTKYLNVTRLETVRFDLGSKSVTWKFDTLGTAPFSLAKVIPGAEGVTVYVAENPAYTGN